MLKERYLDESTLKYYALGTVSRYIIMFDFMFVSSYVKDLVFTGVKLHFPFGFTLFQGIKIML